MKFEGQVVTGSFLLGCLAQLSSRSCLYRSLCWKETHQRQVRALSALMGCHLNNQAATSFLQPLLQPHPSAPCVSQDRRSFHPLTKLQRFSSHSQNDSWNRQERLYQEESHITEKQWVQQSSDRWVMGLGSFLLLFLFVCFFSFFFSHSIQKGGRKLKAFVQVGWLWSTWIKHHAFRIYISFINLATLCSRS